MALTEAELEALATNPQSATTDGLTVTSRSASDILKLRDAAATAAVVTGTNENGGSVSGWGSRFTRPARVIPPGGV